MKKLLGPVPDKYAQKTIKLMGEKIKNERVKKELSEASLAKKAGISVLQLRKIEEGTAQSKLEIYLKLFAVLGMSFAKALKNEDQ